MSKWCNFNETELEPGLYLMRNVSIGFFPTRRSKAEDVERGQTVLVTKLGEGEHDQFNSPLRLHLLEDLVDRKGRRVRASTNEHTEVMKID